MEMEIDDQEGTWTAAEFHDTFEKFVRASGGAAFANWLADRPAEGEAKQERKLLPRRHRFVAGAKQAGGKLKAPLQTMPEADKQGQIGYLRSRNDRPGVKVGNTPDKIYTREEGAAFYCHACGKRYQQCKCEVYISADTVGEAYSKTQRQVWKSRRRKK
jgi:hypothetical protein